MTTAAALKDVEHARRNMIEQQIRTWDVLDQSVLDLLSLVRREQFVPPALQALAFIDMELPLRLDGVDTGETMLAPRVEARFLQEAAIRPHERVLDIGTGSGYQAALAAHKAQSVVSIEIDPRLKTFGESNLLRAGIRNVRVELGDAAQGWTAHAPYDVIIVSGSLPVLPAALLDQLHVGGRLIAVVGDVPAMRAQRVQRNDAHSFDTVDLFETELKPLRNAFHPSAFRF